MRLYMLVGWLTLSFLVSLFKSIAFYRNYLAEKKSCRDKTRRLALATIIQHSFFKSKTSLGEPPQLSQKMLWYAILCLLFFPISGSFLIALPYLIKLKELWLSLLAKLKIVKRKIVNRLKRKRDHLERQMWFLGTEVRRLEKELQQARKIADEKIVSAQSPPEQIQPKSESVEGNQFVDDGKDVPREPTCEGGDKQKSIKIEAAAFMKEK